MHTYKPHLLRLNYTAIASPRDEIQRFHIRDQPQGVAGVGSAPDVDHPDDLAELLRRDDFLGRSAVYLRSIGVSRRLAQPYPSNRG